MIDVEALAVEAGISGVLHREEVARLVCMALEEAAWTAEQQTLRARWAASMADAKPILPCEVAAKIRALKPS